MDSKYQSWSAFLPYGLTLDMIYVYAAAALVFAATIIIGKSLTEKKPNQMKIKQLMERRAELRDEYVNTKRRRRNRKGGEENIEFMQKVVKKFNLLQESKIKDINRLMVGAGYRNKSAAIKFAFAQGVFAIGFMLFSLIFVEVDPSNITKTAMRLLIPFGALYAGAALPRILVVNRRDKRYAEIRKGLPDALDLMMICTEAGLTLSAALDRVSKELGVAYPELTDELAITSIEIGFLPERRKALENLAERVNLPELRALTSILIQTEKYGTPVSQALRVLSKEFRTQRMLAAEQKAARLPALMTVPMICFILPTLFVVVIAPALINVFNQG